MYDHYRPASIVKLLDFGTSTNGRIDIQTVGAPKWRIDVERSSRSIASGIVGAFALHSVGGFVALVIVGDDHSVPLLATLLVLVCIEMFLGIWLARRVRSAQSERERLLNRVVDASDSARQRIARDLHDGVVQDLAGVSFTIAVALEQLGPEVDPHSRAALREAAATTRRGIRQLRTLLVDLYPPNLRREGLESAIGDLLARAQSGGIATSLEIDPAVVLDATSEELAFRVAQEAMRNTLRHAHASCFDVTLCMQNNFARLTLCDDGRGFDLTAERPAGHFGLQLLRDAAVDQGARLTIDSVVGEGTTITLEMKVTQ